MLHELDEMNFQSEVLDADVPVLLDFWAKGCGPCMQIAPMLEQLSEEMSGAAKICKMDAGANMELATRYGVRSVPNLLFFKNGEVKEQFIGARISKEQLRVKLEALV